jgi:hypothetical protein
MKCGGHCENVCLQIGHYNLKSHMFSIDMGGCDIVLGVEWLHTLGPITMDFKELYMSSNRMDNQYKFQGITTGSPEIISSHRMEKLLKKGHSGIISQFHAIQAVETPSPLFIPHAIYPLQTPIYFLKPPRTPTFPWSP